MFTPLDGKNYPNFSREEYIDKSALLEIGQRKRNIKKAYMSRGEKEFHLQLCNVLQDTIKENPEYSHRN